MADHLDAATTLPSEPGSTVDLVGTIVWGQFRIKSLIGSGGNATVFLAEQIGMDRYAALKFLRGGGEAARRRFRIEARAVSRLTHPNIVVVYSFGELADGSPVLAMEFVEGVNLRTMIDQGPIKAELSLRALRACVSALEYAHGQGIVHRDIKPENVMIGMQDPSIVKVVDFGIARIAGEFSETRSGTIIGTPSYMSPEQGRSEEATHLSDQYSLACVFYEVLTGKPAFQADTLIGLLMLHQMTLPDPPSVAAGNPALRPIDPILMRMLAKKPADRYPNMTALRLELMQLLQDAPDTQVRSSPPRSVSSRKGRRSTDPVVILRQMGELSAFRSAATSAGTPVRVAPDLSDVVDDENESTLYVLGTKSVDWAVDAKPWIRGGVPAHRLLSCVDPGDKTWKVVLPEDMCGGVLSGPLSTDPVIVSATLHSMRAQGPSIIEHMAECTLGVLDIGDSFQKVNYVSTVMEEVEASDHRHSVKQAARLICDELLINAIFHAPRDDNGRMRYGTKSRTERIVLAPEERPLLRWFVTDELIAISVTDPFGAFDIKDINRARSRQQGFSPKLGTGGIGLGLVMASCNALLISLTPGSSCEVLALLSKMPAKIGTLGVTRKLIAHNTRRLGDDLGATFSEVNGIRIAKLSGSIDETSQLGFIFQQTGVLRLDLSQVEVINSAGIMKWMNAEANAHPDLKLELVACSTAFTIQLNYLNLTRALIRSVQAPFICDGCGKHSVHTLSPEQVTQGVQHKLLCGPCGRPLQLDGYPHQYFSVFLGQDSSGGRP